MTYRQSPPSPLLHGMVAADWGVERAAGCASLFQRVLPDDCADLICAFNGAEADVGWVLTMSPAMEVSASSTQALRGIHFPPSTLYLLIKQLLAVLKDDDAEVSDWGRRG